jgi:hypothetical protein
MKRIALAAAALLAASAAGLSPAAAQFNAEWCTQGWMTDCAYHTLDQCRAAASGNGWTCVRNLNFPPPKQQRKKRREQ